VRRVAHRLELARHLVDRNVRQVGAVAAAPGKRLVLEVEGQDPGALEGVGGALGVQRIGIAVVGVGDDRDTDGIEDLLQPLGDLGRR
jgi:hypothetical protein